jgi:hypothetical protein
LECFAGNNQFGTREKNKTKIDFIVTVSCDSWQVDEIFRIALFGT